MAVLHIEIWEQTLTKDTHIQNIKSVYELQKYKNLTNQTQLTVQ